MLRKFQLSKMIHAIPKRRVSTNEIGWILPNSKSAHLLLLQEKSYIWKCRKELPKMDEGEVYFISIPKVFQRDIRGAQPLRDYQFELLPNFALGTFDEIKGGIIVELEDSNTGIAFPSTQVAISEICKYEPYINSLNANFEIPMTLEVEKCLFLPLCSFLQDDLESPLEVIDKKTIVKAFQTQPIQAYIPKKRALEIVNEVNTLAMKQEKKSNLEIPPVVVKVKPRIKPIKQETIKIDMSVQFEEHQEHLDAYLQAAISTRFPNFQTVFARLKYCHGYTCVYCKKSDRMIMDVSPVDICTYFNRNCNRETPHLVKNRDYFTTEGELLSYLSQKCKQAIAAQFISAANTTT